MSNISISAIVEKLGESQEIVDDLLAKYKLSEQDLINMVLNMRSDIEEGCEGSTTAAVLSGIIIGLEYAYIYNLEKEAGL